MYEDFLKGVLAYVQALNKAAADLKGADEMLTPYVQFVPVLLEDDICGFLIDEVDGSYGYQEVTPEARDWWNNRPWRKRAA